ncbi:MAG: metal-dependent transcriptional regulator [Eubacteriaceae bacterium]|nr:metal-dependent transcriptional regulator [Eubacteriaceae bacterium]
MCLWEGTMHESGEMYLENILILGKKQNIVRSVDVAGRMNISKASVSRAMTKLREEECIIIDSNGHIAFTEKGRSIAETIYERHRVLTDMLVSLGVSQEIAESDACKIEHDISPETFEAIKNHVKR